VPMHPKDWRFVANACGKPRVTNGPEWIGTLDFNLSHTDGLVVLGLSRGRALGIDTESTNRVIDITLTERFFSNDEIDALRAATVAARQTLFIELWTLKESYLKALGLGLSTPLDQFTIRFTGTRHLQLITQAQHGGASVRWRLWQFWPSKAHVVALCVQGGDTEPIRIHTTCSTPLLGEHSTVWTATRTTSSGTT
jgi:4'-phosphopantetheinyl transferase